MRHVNWWFIGGTVATIVIAVTLSALWSLPGLGAIGAGWGALIGADIRESLKRDRAHLPPAEYPTWIDPVFTVMISAGLLAVGLLIGIVLTSFSGDAVPIAGPSIAAALLGALALACAGALILRQRSIRAERYDK